MDPTNQIYSKASLKVAILRAVRAYSEYRSCLRRITSGAVTEDGAAGATTLIAVGGPYYLNQSVIVDVGGPAQETATIAGITPLMSEDQPIGYVELTFSAGLANAHSAGALLLMSKPGLVISVDQDTYLLPQDFVDIEHSSFDMAIGAKLVYRKQNGYYDASSVISNQLSGTGFGRASNWGPSPYFGYPIAGNPYDNPNSNITSPAQMAWRFYTSDNPYLRVIPQPQAGCTLDFDYYGCHTIQSVPSADQELIVLYAKYAALTARANAMNESNGGDVRIEEYQQDPSRNSAQLLSLAKDAYSLWEDKLRFIPYGTSG
jgi:hypothetical protein